MPNETWDEDCSTSGDEQRHAECRSRSSTVGAVGRDSWTAIARIDWQRRPNLQDYAFESMLTYYNRKPFSIINSYLFSYFNLNFALNI